MWDPEQRAEIPVLIDRLQTRGDPLGEWLALRQHLDAGELGRDVRQALRRRVRHLRDELGPSLILADDASFGQVYVIREQGLIADVSFFAATPERLAALLARSDAPFVLRLSLRGRAPALRGCVELLRARHDLSEVIPAPADAGPSRDDLGESLRELALEPVDEAGEADVVAASALKAELLTELGDLGVALPSLFALGVGGAALGLPFDRAALEHGRPWTSSRRVTLGRALFSGDPLVRRRALELMREHGRDAGQLRAPLIAIIEGEPSAEVRAAALEVIPQLGELAHTLIVLVREAARERDDPQLREWLNRLKG